MLLTGLLLMFCSTCFLIISKTTSRGVAPCSIDWALQHHHWLKIALQTCLQPHFMETFSQLRFASLRWLKLCQVYLELAITQPWNLKSQENNKDEVSQTLTIVPRNDKFTDRKSERLKRIMTTRRVDFPSKWGQATTKAHNTNYKMDG